MTYDDDLYRLIPEEGKHLANSNDTEGAYRGVYLDDETNKPSGAGEFVKVNPEDLVDSSETNPVENEPPSGDAAAIAAILGIGIAIGVVIAKAFPYVKQWATETAIPKAKTLWNKLLNKPEQLAQDSSIEFPIVNDTTEHSELSIDVAFNNYRENMSSEEAQKELLDAFLLYLISAKKLMRVANANIVEPTGTITDGKSVIATITSDSMIESINSIIKCNPELLDESHAKALSEILGHKVFVEAEYVPITQEELTLRLKECEITAPRAEEI